MKTSRTGSAANHLPGYLLGSFLLLFSIWANAQEIRVAVASNFAQVAKVLSNQFAEDTGHHILLSSGSTGKHYAQIRNGAPFDIFLAADEQRPGLLEADGIALPGSCFTYAIGKLVLWSQKADYVDQQGSVLESADFHYLAIANPALAPYGVAAKQVLQSRNLWLALQERMVRGENISQTFQFVRSGNAQLGFVAFSQLQQNAAVEGSYWLVPQTLYTPIRQQAVLLKDYQPARDFLTYLGSAEALQIIRRYGYDTP